MKVTKYLPRGLEEIEPVCSKIVWMEGGSTELSLKKKCRRGCELCLPCLVFMSVIVLNGLFWVLFEEGGERKGYSDYGTVDSGLCENNIRMSLLCDFCYLLLSVLSCACVVSSSVSLSWIVTSCVRKVNVSRLNNACCSYVAVFLTSFLRTV